MAVMNQKPTIVDLILSRSTTTVNEYDSWKGSNNHRTSFASDRYPHRALRESTALHYACLLGDMEIAEVLLRHGAMWTISDSIGLLPVDYIDVSKGDDKKAEFNRLCEKQTSKTCKKEERPTEEDESEGSKKLAGEEKYKLLKKPAEEGWEKLTKEDVLLKRCARRGKCFPSPPSTVLM